MILLNEDTKCLVQGITGKQGSFHTEQMLNYNTNIVAGIVKETDKVCYVDGNFQLEDFKFSVAYLISVTIIAFPVIINEYLKNDNIKQQYDLFMENFEKSFKDLIWEVKI